MEKLLYIGHEFHRKTKSTGFLSKLLSEKYEITCYTLNPRLAENLDGLADLAEKEFDVLVCFQVMPSIEKIRQFIKFKRGVLFPMYDYYYSCTPLTNPVWKEYTDFLIICFSKHLYDDVRRAGFAAKFIRFFPVPAKNVDPGDVRSMFFWQRVTHINVYSLWPLIRDYALKSLHIHQTVDPLEKFVPVPSDTNAPQQAYYSKISITYSTWYENKSDMTRDMLKSAIFIAPRYHEGIGMSFLEAMANGRCVIAADNPTMNEYIKHGKTGFLYTLGSQDSLCLTEEKIRAVQKQTYKYICSGFAKWEKEKLKLVKWVSSRFSGSAAKLAKAEKKYGWNNKGAVPPPEPEKKCTPKDMVKRCCPAGIWTLGRKLYNAVTGRTVPWIARDYYIFGILPVLCVKQTAEKRRIRIEIFRIPVFEKHTFYFGEKE